MDKPAIRVEGLSKRYRLGTIQMPYGRLTESLSAAFRRPFKKKDPSEIERGYHWALKDVSFDVPHGDVVGIIGRNGAGKTTLLKILSRITDPTEGTVRLRGRVGALLEVGAGFHPELTGRENVFLNGAILGMGKQEITSRFDEIVAFAEVERFIDTPVKRYSSGMFLRLAFAVAAHLEPEILIVDEVLAVGDAAFQKKCLGKMGDVAGAGRTVLFVSHNMGAVRTLCKRVILIEKGRVHFEGDPSDAIASYLAASGQSDADGQVWWAPGDPETPASEEIELKGIQLLTSSGEVSGIHEADKPIDIEIYYELKTPLRGARMVIGLTTPEGEIAFRSTDHDRRPASEEPGSYRASCRIPGGILNRRAYSLSVSFDITGVRILLPTTDHLSFTVEGGGNQGSDFTENWPGIVCPALDWSVERVDAPPQSLVPAAGE